MGPVMFHKSQHSLKMTSYNRFVFKYKHEPLRYFVIEYK